MFAVRDGWSVTVGLWWLVCDVMVGKVPSCLTPSLKANIYFAQSATATTIHAYALKSSLSVHVPFVFNFGPSFLLKLCCTLHNHSPHGTAFCWFFPSLWPNWEKLTNMSVFWPLHDLLCQKSAVYFFSFSNHPLL